MKNLLSSNTQLHHLTINDSNLLVSLGQRIRELKEKVTTINKIVLLHSEKQKRSKARPQIDKDLKNLLHLVQLDFYGSITAKANTIDPVVVSPDDRYFLRVHLTPLLTLSNKLNELISPWVETEVKRIHNELKKMDSIEGLKLANLVKYITTTMIKDNY